MLQASLGVVADAESRQGFIDFDSVPKEGAPVSEVVAFLLSEQASKLRPDMQGFCRCDVDVL